MFLVNCILICLSAAFAYILGRLFIQKSFATQSTKSFKVFWFSCAHLFYTNNLIDQCVIHHITRKLNPCVSSFLNELK